MHNCEINLRDFAIINIQLLSQCIFETFCPREQREIPAPCQHVIFLSRETLRNALRQRLREARVKMSLQQHTALLVGGSWFRSTDRLQILLLLTPHLQFAQFDHFMEGRQLQDAPHHVRLTRDVFLLRRRVRQVTLKAHLVVKLQLQAALKWVICVRKKQQINEEKQ